VKKVFQRGYQQQGKGGRTHVCFFWLNLKKKKKKRTTFGETRKNIKTKIVPLNQKGKGPGAGIWQGGRKKFCFFWGGLVLGDKARGPPRNTPGGGVGVVFKETKRPPQPRVRESPGGGGIIRKGRGKNRTTKTKLKPKRVYPMCFPPRKGPPWS